MLLQSNSMLSPFNESPWRLQVVSSFQLLWSFPWCFLLSCFLASEVIPRGLNSQALLDLLGVAEKVTDSPCL